MNNLGRCAACRSVRPLRGLLLVKDRVTGAERFVCRPGLDEPGAGRCFATVGRRDLESIALADPAAERAKVPA